MTRAWLSTKGSEQETSQQQKGGGIVCLPKVQGNQKPEDYRPITFLNSEYKILTRIIVQRLRAVLADHLTET